MIEKGTTKYKGKYFVRVMLHSGTRYNPLGNEELAIFCESDREMPSETDVDQMRLLRWVNENPSCKRNQSNQHYRISQQADAFSVIYLNEREIQACRAANRIFPCS
jgi:hypothetical protein